MSSISFLFVLDLFSVTMLPSDIDIIDINRRIGSLESQFNRLNTTFANLVTQFSNIAKLPTEVPYQSAFTITSAPVREFSSGNNCLLPTVRPIRWGNIWSGNLIFSNHV